MATNCLIERKDGKPIAAAARQQVCLSAAVRRLDAETGADEIMARLRPWPDVKKRVKALMRVAGRRWDLKLDNGVVDQAAGTRHGSGHGGTRRIRPKNIRFSSATSSPSIFGSTDRTTCS
jgi:hypothetical protein